MLTFLKNFKSFCLNCPAWELFLRFFIFTGENPYTFERIRRHAFDIFVPLFQIGRKYMGEMEKSRRSGVEGKA